jgi:hypothetical protein
MMLLRRRAAMKWAGVVLCAVMLVSWGASRWFLINITNVGEYSTLAQLSAGEVSVTWFQGRARHWPGPGWHIEGERRIPEWRWKVRWSTELRIQQIAVPLYLPLAVLALPTVWLFYRDRRSVRWSREGRCAGCGYDLSGVSGKCPECGRDDR